MKILGKFFAYSGDFLTLNSLFLVPQRVKCTGSNSEKCYIIQVLEFENFVK